LKKSLLPICALAIPLCLEAQNFLTVGWRRHLIGADKSRETDHPHHC
jgi:hypothetical protein